MLRILAKPPMSSVFARNWDMMAVAVVVNCSGAAGVQKLRCGCEDSLLPIHRRIGYLGVGLTTLACTCLQSIKRRIVGLTKNKIQRLKRHS